MVLPVHRRYEIIFLSLHSIGPKYSHAAVAKVVKCDITTVKYWLKRWKQSKDLSDSIRSGRSRGTTHKQDEQIVSLVRTTEHSLQLETSKTSWRRQELQSTRENDTTVLEQKQESNTIDFHQSHCLSKCIEKIVLKWAQGHKATNWEQVIFSDETNIRRNTVKGLVQKLTGKKEDPSNRQAFDQGERKSGIVFQVNVLVASSVFSGTSTLN